MKKTWYVILFLVIAFAFIGCTDSREPIDVTQFRHFTVSIPTAEEEAEQVINSLRSVQLFVSQNIIYPPSSFRFPNTSLFNDAMRRIEAGEILTVAEENQLREHFINDVYDARDYQRYFNTLARAVQRADERIDSLRRFENAWGFYIPNVYRIFITVWGIGSTATPATATINMFSDHIMLSPNLLYIIDHEVIHIGIDERIIRRFNIPHWTMERIVDLFQINHFGPIGRPLQQEPEYPIDIIFEQPDVLDYLPQRVEEFLREHRQQ